MSQIASFYTIDKDMSEALLEAAVPQRKVIGKKILFFKRKIEQTVDVFWNFIKAQATPQESFGYSGTGFTDLELLLAEKGINLYQFGQDEFAGKLSAARPSVVAVFDQAATKKTIKMVAAINITADEARAYSQEQFPEEDDAMVAKSIVAAHDFIKRWLASVGESQIGLLIIG
jgi:hypothetical protein